MKITQRPTNSDIWEFHDLTAEEQDEVTRFVEESGHGTLVNPYSPIAIAFTDPKVVDAFRQRFGKYIE
jgi:hypothetical protein